MFACVCVCIRVFVSSKLFNVCIFHLKHSHKSPKQRVEIFSIALRIIIIAVAFVTKFASEQVHSQNTIVMCKNLVIYGFCFNGFVLVVVVVVASLIFCFWLSSCIYIITLIWLVLCALFMWYYVGVKLIGEFSCFFCTTKNNVRITTEWKIYCQNQTQNCCIFFFPFSDK